MLHPQQPPYQIVAHCHYYPSTYNFVVTLKWTMFEQSTYAQSQEVTTILTLNNK
jgi:hypothetical protein